MSPEGPVQDDPWRQLQQLVADDPDLRSYLQLSFKSFHSTGDWPDVEQLQRQLLREREPLDLYGVGDRIPSELGTNPVRVDNRCQLTVTGVALCADAQEEVRDFLNVLVLASEKYLSESPDQQSSEAISSDELRGTLHMTDLAVRRAFRMIEWEPFIAGGDGSIDVPWRRNVGNMMRHFVGVTKLDEYLRVKASLYPRRRLLIASESLPLIGKFSYYTGPPLAPPWTPKPLPLQSEAVDAAKPDPRLVFVVHGRNDRARDGIFTFLRALGLKPIEWSHAVSMTGQGSPYIGDVLDTAFSGAQAIVVLFTPDEVAYLKPEFSSGDDDPETKPSEQARPNVLFESGMALGRDPRRTVLVELGRVRPFSDIVGRHAVRLDGSAKTRNDLAQRLRTAGCSVDLSGTDWLTAGNLTPPVKAGETSAPKPSLDQPSQHKVDLKYHPAERGAGRLEVINLSAEALHDLNVSIPPEASSFQLVAELPVDRLPAGKSVYLMAVRVMGGGSKTHFDVKVTARNEDGSNYEDEVFLSI